MLAHPVTLLLRWAYLHSNTDHACCKRNNTGQQPQFSGMCSLLHFSSFMPPQSPDEMLTSSVVHSFNFALLSSENFTFHPVKYAEPHDLFWSMSHEEPVCHFWCPALSNLAAVTGKRGKKDWRCHNAQEWGLCHSQSTMALEGQWVPTVIFTENDFVFVISPELRFGVPSWSKIMWPI